MIRYAKPADREAMLELALATGLFKSDEISQLSSTLEAYDYPDAVDDETWLVDDERGVKGLAYLAPERMTQGTWNLYLIAVHPDHQKSGRGASILRRVERLLIERDQRVLLVETMGIAEFDFVRSFYQKMGFVQEARIRDFYDRGQDKIVYWKPLK